MMLERICPVCGNNKLYINYLSSMINGESLECSRCNVNLTQPFSRFAPQFGLLGVGGATFSKFATNKIISVLDLNFAWEILIFLIISTLILFLSSVVFFMTLDLSVSEDQQSKNNEDELNKQESIWFKIYYSLCICFGAIIGALYYFSGGVIILPLIIAFSLALMENDKSSKIIALATVVFILSSGYGAISLFNFL